MIPEPFVRPILQGNTNQARFIRLESAATLANPAVEALLKEALKRAKNPIPMTGKGQTIIKIHINQAETTSN
jgi:hypothetical protein